MAISVSQGNDKLEERMIGEERRGRSADETAPNVHKSFLLNSPVDPPRKIRVKGFLWQ